MNLFRKTKSFTMQRYDKITMIFQTMKTYCKHLILSIDNFFFPDYRNTWRIIGILFVIYYQKHYLCTNKQL